MLKAVVGFLVGFVVLVVAGCGSDGVSSTSSTSAGGPDSTNTPTSSPSSSGDEVQVGEDAVAFTWTSTVDVDGFGADVTAEGVVGEGWATYALHAEPIIADREAGDYDDLLARTTDAALNGFAGGSSEVVVVGTDRWYRLPWALEELGGVLQGAEWIHVLASGPSPSLDLMTFVVTERWDRAVRDLLDAVAAGEPFFPPEPDREAAGFVLIEPWLGVDDGLSPDDWPGASAERGTASWEQIASYEPDGFDGRLAVTVNWAPTEATPPSAPSDTIEATDVSRRIAG